MQGKQQLAVACGGGHVKRGQGGGSCRRGHAPSEALAAGPGCQRLSMAGREWPVRPTAGSNDQDRSHPLPQTPSEPCLCGSHCVKCTALPTDPVWSPVGDLPAHLEQGHAPAGSGQKEQGGAGRAQQVHSLHSFSSRPACAQRAQGRWHEGVCVAG